MKMLKPIVMMIALLASVFVMAQEGYKVGDVAADFKLKNIDGKYYSLNDIEGAKGYVVIFTCNHCPYSIAYEDRIIDLHNTYAPMGYPVVAVNPNDSIVQPGDSWSKMKVRAEEKKFPFLYLLDEKQEVFPVYGATRTPHVFLLKKEENGLLRVAYIGAIDDNYKDAAAVEKPYLADAIMAVDKGKSVSMEYTRAIGCTIKVQK